MAVQVIKRTAVVPGVQQAVAGIDRQIAVMKRLVDDLTDVSRLVTNKITLQVEKIEICSLCEQAIVSIQPLIDAKHHTLKVDCAKYEIFADPIRLQQVISNLLSNAAKFTPSGGNIAITAKAENGGVRIIVEDDGKGMDQATIDNIFNMFFQEETQSGSGIGVGLTLAKKLVELHGGTISVSSGGKNKGSTFVVTLPSCPVEKIKRGIRVLIIDDNSDHANALSVLLEMENYHVRVAYDGISGLEENNRFEPDVIFLDIGMPLMDGYEVISRIRRTAGKPYIVAVTSFGQPGDKMRVKTAGFDEHLVKPPDDKKIFEILERVGKQ
jgi:CheY-like chemotaxis protein/anti-sigma regulatory factor (Ser/Thr protein kinase)